MPRYGLVMAVTLMVAPAGGIAQTAAETPPSDAPEMVAAEAPALEVWLETLQTDTPQQGFDLAVSMARRAVKTTQPDTDVLKAQRPAYAGSADSLIDVSGVAAAWFATVAAANDYWRE